MNYTLENFINYCDTMEIADEGFREDVKKSKVGQSIGKIFERLAEIFTKLYERYRQIILKIKNKMTRGKNITIPEEYHKQMKKLYERMKKSWNGHAGNLESDSITISDDDGNEQEMSLGVNNAKKEWADLKDKILNDMKKHADEQKAYTKICDIPPKLIYDRSMKSSKLIVTSLNEIKNFRKTISDIDKNSADDTAKENIKNSIAKFKLQIEMSKLFIDIDNMYLMFLFKE